jgi:hypothetical protein
MAAKVEPSQIAEALAEVFRIPGRDVTVSDSIEDISDQPIFCLRSTVSGGDFPVLVSVYTSLATPDCVEMLVPMARRLQCSLLVSDDESSNPYSATLVRPNGDVLEVLVSPEALDDDNEYRLLDRGVAGLLHGVEGPRGQLASVQAGDSCPREGYWFTPAQIGSRRRFRQGEPMPRVDGDYGLTIWQWDKSQ